VGDLEGLEIEGLEACAADRLALTGEEDGLDCEEQIYEDGEECEMHFPGFLFAELESCA